ncbi:MAG: PHP domain-containing protein [bacterium]
MKLDLHIHSIYSDGSLSPEEIIDTAIELGISAISITDHDNLLGCKLAQKYLDSKLDETGKNLIEVIPGIEINTLWKAQEVHILGYYMDLSSKNLLDVIAYQQHARIQQTIEIIEKLNKEANLNIKMEDITAFVAEGGSIGRPHIAKTIAKAIDVKNISLIYTRYISDNSPTYVKRKTITPHEAVDAVYEAGGIPILAHPCDMEMVEDMIKDLMNHGLRGIEAYHRKHSPAMIEYYSCMAEKYELIVTGGSDCHGMKFNKQLFLGKNFIPGWILTELKKEKNRIEIASK